MYARKVGDRTLTFAVSGMLVRDSLVMVDRQTGSLWSQLTGQALEGPMAGQRLEMLVATQASWGVWRRGHPDTQVLAFDPTLVADPNTSYYADARLGIVHDQDIAVDPRLEPKEKVIGLRLDGHVKAYRLGTLARDRVVNDLVGGAPVLVVFDAASESGAVFRRDPIGRVLTFAPGPQSLEVIDRETASVWDGLSGRSTSGRLEGTVMEQIPVTYGFWFAWSFFYPETDVFA